jgi:hypothetical protein
MAWFPVLLLMAKHQSCQGQVIENIDGTVLSLGIWWISTTGKATPGG